MSNETASGLYGRREARPPVLRERPARALRRSSSPGSRHGSTPPRHEVRQMVVLGLLALAVGAAVFGRGLAKRALSSLRASAGGETPGEAAAAPAAPVDVRSLMAGSHAADDLLLEVDQLLGRNMAAEAVARLNRQLKITPENHALRLSLARVYRRQARAAEAEEILGGILTAQPRHLEARLELARLAHEANRFGDAHEIARWVIEDHPANSEALRIADEACMSEGWYAAAQSYLRPLMDADQNQPDVREMMGVASLRLQQHAKAISHLSEAMKMPGHSPMAHFHVAAAYARQDQVKDAVDALVIAAQRYGNDRVLPWLGTEDFEKIRDDALFAALRAQLSQPATASLASRVPDSASGEVSARLAPEPILDTSATEMIKK